MSEHPTGIPSRDTSKRSPLIIIMQVFGVVLILLVLSAVAAVIYATAVTPEQTVVSARQFPARYARQLDSLGLLQEGEQLQLIYCDGFFDIRDGMYLLTDRHVILYDRSNVEPAWIIPFSEIEDVSIEYSDSWLDDSVLTLFLRDDDVAVIPLSNTNNGDRLWYNKLMGYIESSEVSESNID